MVLSHNPMQNGSMVEIDTLCECYSGQCALMHMKFTSTEEINVSTTIVKEKMKEKPE
jgi:hypothetical protein